MGINQLKAAAEIGDFESAQEFTKKSIATAGEANRRLLECGSKIVELGTGFKNDVSNLIGRTQEEAKSAQEKVTQEKKAAK
jgi:phasin family protein